MKDRTLPPSLINLKMYRRTNEIRQIMRAATYKGESAMSARSFEIRLSPAGSLLSSTIDETTQGFV